jgi:pyridoxal phosphate enzyme (YggS family)
VTDLGSRIREIELKISEAARRSGRNPEEVALMAVTKTRSPAEIGQAWDAGIRLFGENRVQEAAIKIENWPKERFSEWRLIGHLQRNKARKALALFSRIESLDRLDLADDLERVLAERGGEIEALVEVNTSGEISKHGVSPGGLERLLESVLRTCPRVKLRGLMTVGPLDGSPARVAEAFGLLRELGERMSGNLGLEMPELSMGMSDDFEMAIEQGSTCVRLGRALFGPREYREV